MPQEEFNKSCENIKSLYNKEISEEYIRWDKNYFLTECFQMYQMEITALLKSVKEPSILELGCGTGRYFKCYPNEAIICGIDVSSCMLEQAKKVGYFGNRKTTFFMGDIHDPPSELQKMSFDLILSIGVLGEYTPLTTNILNIYYHMIRKPGYFYLTVVDSENIENKVDRSDFQEKFDPELWEENYLCKNELEYLIAKSNFSNYTIKRIKDNKHVHHAVTLFK